MPNFLYVDNSNVWIEGMHVAAVSQGEPPDIWTAQDRNITAPWSCDFGRLLYFAGGEKEDIGRAVLYGSRPPANDSLWGVAQQRGFEVIVYDRYAANREKKIDTRITADMIEDSYELMKADRDEITLLSGDKDYVPAIEKVRRRNFTVHVVFWDHAARELKEAANKFIVLDPYLEHLRRN
jgi:hypothetical protein